MVWPSLVFTVIIPATKKLHNLLLVLLPFSAPRPPNPHTGTALRPDSHTQMITNMKHAHNLMGFSGEKARARRKLALLASARAKVVRAYIQQASVAGLTRLRCTYSLLFRWIPSELQLPPGVPHAASDGTPSAGIWEQAGEGGSAGGVGGAAGAAGSAAGEGGSVSVQGDGSKEHPLEIV